MRSRTLMPRHLRSGSSVSNEFGTADPVGPLAGSNGRSIARWRYPPHKTIDSPSTTDAPPHRPSRSSLDRVDTPAVRFSHRDGDAPAGYVHRPIPVACTVLSLG